MSDRHGQGFLASTVDGSRGSRLTAASPNLYPLTSVDFCPRLSWRLRRVDCFSIQADWIIDERGKKAGQR
jgi:hypothetical protein